MANDVAAARTTARDAIGVEVFANLFKAVVDEMAWVVLRSSHTTFVKETQDFAVALVTPEGEMFAYPYGSGATVLMGVAMDSVTQGIAWEEGDVVITQDLFVYDFIGEDQNGRIVGKHRSTGIGKPRFWDRARYFGEEQRLAAALDASEAEEPLRP